ncbi:MAG TPA: toll/interleukin-1 receptor domain-containing protein [Flavisolibacter sp.]|jgi:hypothetical protein|nr:toll/interleukin-1 receptor domain-containing protein [Flavisolibacter sp.]
MEKKVFLSYANNDKVYANLLAKSLKKKGVSAFTFNEMTPDEEWDDVLRKELSESSAFIALISGNWNRSNFAALEYGAAFAMGKKIIPVVIDNTTNDDVAIDLNRYSLVDAKNEDMETVAQQVEGAI